MKTSIKTLIYSLIVVFLVSCAGSKPASEKAAKAEKEPEDYSEYTSMFDVLNSIAGVTIRRTGNGVETMLRGQQSILNTSEPLFVLNGVPLGRNFNSISHINPVQVTEVKIQRSLAAANRWGSEGNAGAILIKTRSNQ